jgi:hypothetical protein
MKVTDEQFDKFCSEMGIELLEYQKVLLKKILNEQPLMPLTPKMRCVMSCGYVPKTISEHIGAQLDGYKAKLIIVDENLKGEE